MYRVMFMAQTVQQITQQKRDRKRYQTIHQIQTSLVGVVLLASLGTSVSGCQSLHSFERSISSNKNPEGYIVIEGGAETSYRAHPSRKNPLGSLQEGEEITVGIDVFRFIDYLNGRGKARTERREPTESSAADILFDAGRARPFENYLVRE